MTAAKTASDKARDVYADAVVVQQSVAATLAAEFPTTRVDTVETAEWLAGADVIEGFDLEQDKANLCGVPFKVLAAVFRNGKTDKKTQRIYNYASVEIEIGPAAVVGKAARRRANNPNLSVIEPGERLVFNDGSTGVCRQLVSYLHAKGLITVPEGPENGGAGESRYDTYRSEWRVNGVPVPAEDALRVEIPNGLVCLRGLRVSEYDTDGQETTTYYFG